jgi:hypothetical protein
MEIHFTLKQTYGKVRAVPLCINAITFADIAGTSTLTLRAMRNVEALGYKLMCAPMFTGGTTQMNADQLKEAGVE